MRWLRHVVVWRFVGVVSTVVGLVCYALSSSFNCLFGEWTWFKISLYSVFCLFICLWSLFAKVCQQPTSFRVKAHLAFLVLTITSVYSYFADHVVNGKPDAYSLISCAAFAIMSLSLSTQTQCEFEVDLFYFFLACLIVLLMQIKLALAIVGVGFSYALIILRSSLVNTSYESLGDVHSVVIDVNSLRTDSASMMLQLMTCDMFEKTCCEVYCNWRRESIEACLFELGKITINNKRPPSVIPFIVALRILFPNERQLCGRVFSGFSSVADFCFTEVCEGPMVKLLNFAHDYASKDLCNIRLFGILDMCETLRDIFPEFKSLFPESVVNDVAMVCKKLEQACWDILMRMEDEIFCSPYVDVIVRPDAKDHPMTRCVMDYLRRNLYQFTRLVNATGTSSVSDHIDRIMKRLERQLVAMSKNYKYPALRHLFVMNNWSYIEQRAAMLGLDHDFFNNCATIVQQNQELYQRNAWKMVLDFLKLENDELVDAESIKDNLIYKHIEFICRHQSTWLASKDLITPIDYSDIIESSAGSRVAAGTGEPPGGPDPAPPHDRRSRLERTPRSRRRSRLARPDRGGDRASRAQIVAEIAFRVSTAQIPSDLGASALINRAARSSGSSSRFRRPFQRFSTAFSSQIQTDLGVSVPPRLPAPPPSRAGFPSPRSRRHWFAGAPAEKAETPPALVLRRNRFRFS
ncbi:hypothetical protein VNO78_31315 [Psophocarpus tetragonolobus]|uniref:Exocyst subunit Exo70 family protein n=1 Tax=Psophocarpus tetragonolobus TaxID=3891 RepID=A0AAN9X9B3_PSOTE